MTELEQMIRDANKAYREGDPIISDAEYDILIEELKRKDPNNQWFSKIEPSPIGSGRKVKLPVPMKSLDKVKDVADLEKWVRSVKDKCGTDEDLEVVVMPKYDGLSLLVDDRTGFAASRGGTENEGQDCSKHYKAIADVQGYVNAYTFGEFLISNESWNNNFAGKIQENGNKYRSPRNTAAGFLNRDEPSPEIKHCSFIRYGASFENNVAMKIIGDYSSLLHTLSTVYQQPYVARLTKFSSLVKFGHDWLLELFKSWRDIYPIDGLVIYVNKFSYWDVLGRKENGNPNYAIAYKHPDFTDTFETTVKHVEWQVSKSGALKPVVVVDEVDNGDCVMDSPTGYNARWIRENGIGEGSKVIITRSGGVIPKILSTPEKVDTSYVLSLKCPCCGEDTSWNESGIDRICNNPDCIGKKLAKFVFFYKTVGVENVGEETLKKIIENAPDIALSSLLHSDFSFFYSTCGLGEVVSNNIVSENKRILSGVDLPVLMHASDCFKGIGESKAKIMIEKYPDAIDKLMAPSHFVDGSLYKAKSVTEQSFLDGLLEFSRFINECGICPKSPSIQNITGDMCAGWSVCFSGVRDKELEKIIVENSGKIVSGISKNTTHLVVKGVDGTSSKISKAKQLGVTILSIEQFYGLVQ